MERRYFLFIALSFAFMLTYSALVQRFFPPPARPVKPVNQVAKADPAGTVAATAELTAASDPAATGSPSATGEGSPAVEATTAPTGEPGVNEPVPPAAAANFPQTYHTLGSLDPESGYAMLVHLTSVGGAVSRIELTDGRYLELEDPADDKREPPAYLGQLELDPETAKGAGAKVNVVGPGTPAALAGVQVGDLLKSVGGSPVFSRFALVDALRRFKPDETVDVVVDRGGKTLTLPIKLRRCPMQLVKPEEPGSESLLLTLQTLDEDRIEGVHEEFRGVRMRTTNWELLPGQKANEAVFRCPLPRLGLEVLKKFSLAPATKELAPAPAEGVAAKGDPGIGYGLVMEIEIRNVGTTERKVAYRLDGLCNLPTEGYWFAYKLGGFGQRDVAVRSAQHDTEIYAANEINKATEGKQWLDRAGEEIVYAGVDTQYFAGVLIPLKAKPSDSWFQYVRAVRIGPEKKNAYLTNCNVQFASQPWTLGPNASASHRYLVFAGPKAPNKVLAPYDRLYADGDVKLDWLMKYGWYPFLVLPLTWYLEFLYAIIGNYGLAIILLTATVRLILFPFTRRQALQSLEMSEKMSRIKPDQDRIMEKYKNDPVAKQRALQELWAKNDV
ncbi:MAG TPA: YidC/Oxa1 family insertase periplasmic-domain containing protein, partial [Pirellulales bacterium]